MATYWLAHRHDGGGTTILLAMPLATREPCSFRTMCRHRSIPAAVPALVNTGSSSTYNTSGSTLASGYVWASLSACRQCVVHRLPSSSPAAPEDKRSGAQTRHLGAPGYGLVEFDQQGGIDTRVGTR